MAAVSVRIRSFLLNSRMRRLVLIGQLVLVSGGLVSCTSTQELYAQYDEQFCPASGSSVAAPELLIKPAVVESAVIKEIPAASASMMTWEHAVYYRSESARLSKSAKRALDINIKMLQKLPRHLLAIRGFTDTRTSATYNNELAKKRIAVVKHYLTENGISIRRIVGVSHGESMPLAGEKPAIADDINRRVELLLLDSDGRPVASRHAVMLDPTEA